MVSISTSAKEIFFKLLATVSAFYAVFYIIASLVNGIFRLDEFDGTIPFHYKSYEQMFTNSTRWHDSVFLGDFISLECTYLIAPLGFLIFLRNQLWDYAITVTVLHCGLVCLVNLAFPLTWEWWVCLAIGLLVCIGIGELSSGLLRKKATGSFGPLQKEDNKIT